MSNLIPIEKNIIISVPDEYNTSKKGAYFENLCAGILKKQSYKITSKEIRRIGMEVDLEAIHTPSQKTVYIECKFYNDKSTIDSKIVDLCFAQSFRGEYDKIALFSTVKLGKDAQSTYENYIKKGVDFSFYGGLEILSALEAIGEVENIDSVKFKSNITSATLLIHPEIKSIWLLQETENGSPKGLIAYSSSSDEVYLDKIREILDKEGKLEDLEIKIYEDKSIAIDDSVLAPISREVVSGIVLADDIMDPKPCRPRDFIGRDLIQKDIWEFLESVRLNETSCRILALTGLSGNGKSSLVANLSDRFTNIKWKNKQYLYPVDVRSARGARFVAEAVCKSFNAAIANGFIEYKGNFHVESADDITGGKSFKECAKYLEDNNRVMIIFFDQFEEVFMKEELFSLFRAFRRFALDVSAEKTNVVVGFSWRTGIFLGNDNPAYSLWHDLRDHRTERKLETFDIKDSNKMISSFEREEKIILTKPLKARLILQAQGFPWLLKKLCIHLFSKINEGISQEELLISQMKIKNLFDEDLDRPNREVDCLKFVARKSPVDRYEATKEFGDETVSRLISDRLLIKTGEKISVYWDVFRDYLITNETPVISWAYMPNYSISLIVNIAELIKDNPVSVEELSKLTDYSKGTIQNGFIDLLSFDLVVKVDGYRYKLNCEIDDIPIKIRNQMLGHVIYQEALKFISNADSSIITIDELSSIIGKAYSEDDGKSKKRYMIKILSWFRYSGLMSLLNGKVRIYDSNSFSTDFGECSRGGSKTILFLAASTFENVASLIQKVIDGNFVDQSEVGARNAIADLVALGMCRRGRDNSIELIKNNSSEFSAEKQLAIKVLEADTTILLNDLISRFGNDVSVLAKKMASELGKSWKPATGLRYITSLLRFRNLANKVINGTDD